MRDRVIGDCMDGGWPLLVVLVVAVALLVAWWVFEQVCDAREDRRDLERAGGPRACEGSRFWGGML